MTLLGPLLMGGLIAGFIYLAMNQGNKISKVLVVDETNLLADKLPASKSVLFYKDTMSLNIAREIFNGNEYYGILYLPANAFTNPDQCVLYTEKQPNITVVSYIQSTLQKQIEDIKLANAGISKTTLDSIKTKLDLQQKPVSASGDDEQFSAEATSFIGFGAGLLIYLFIFLYGVQVMRGVVEEKTNRIIEVMISSVKPFQLMMGKIIGVALVGLTQFLLWIILTMAITSGVASVMAGKNADIKEQVAKAQEIQSVNSFDNTKFNKQQEFDLAKIAGVSSINFTKIIVCFIFYFLGGYLLYSALFAAIGAAVDNETDTQQFMFPITLPLIFAYVVSTIVMSNPESSVGYWFSIIPFTSPIVMMVRLPFDPPWVDIIISMVLLVLGFLATTWLAAKIYRVGILMYGKKPTYRELAKWIFYKG